VRTWINAMESKQTRCT